MEVCGSQQTCEEEILMIQKLVVAYWQVSNLYFIRAEKRTPETRSNSSINATALRRRVWRLGAGISRVTISAVGKDTCRSWKKLPP